VREGGGGSQLEEGVVVEALRPSCSGGAHEVREGGGRVVRLLMVESHLLLHLAEHSLRLLAKAVVVAEYRQVTHCEPGPPAAARLPDDYQPNKNA